MGTITLDKAKFGNQLGSWYIRAEGINNASIYSNSVTRPFYWVSGDANLEAAQPGVDLGNNGFEAFAAVVNGGNVTALDFSARLILTLTNTGTGMSTHYMEELHLGSLGAGQNVLLRKRVPLPCNLIGTYSLETQLTVDPYFQFPENYEADNVSTDIKPIGRDGQC